MSNLTVLRAAINQVVRYWNEEGDDAPASELVPDAILHIRWRMEEFKHTPLQAAQDAMKMRH